MLDEIDERENTLYEREKVEKKFKSFLFFNHRVVVVDETIPARSPQPKRSKEHQGENYTGGSN
jgi:hypothetical protein